LGIAAAIVLYHVAVLAHLDLDLDVDEAYYWGWAQALDWGYYSKPPLIAGLLAVSGTSHDVRSVVACIRRP
jgi:hypothetical protein